MFTHPIHFSRFTTLAIALTMSLAAILVMAFVPARTEAALCNRDAALLAHGFSYAPAGNATFTYDPLGRLIVSNIGPSGQDGFCMRGITMDGVERTFEPINLSAPDAEMTLQQRTQAENQLLAMTSFRESGGAVYMFYSDSWSLPLTATLAIYLDDQLVDTVGVDAIGPVAKLDSPDGVFLSGTSSNYITTTVLNDWVEAVFSAPVGITVGDQTFTGDRVGIRFESTPEPRPFFDIFVLNNNATSTMTLLETSFDLWDQTHVTLSESFLIRKLPTDPLTMRGFGEPQTLESGLKYETEVIDYRADFPAPVQIAETGDQLSLSGWNDEEGQEMLVGRLEFIGDTGTHEVACASFPDNQGGIRANVDAADYIVWRDNVIIFETTLPGGECLEIPRPLAVSQMQMQSQTDPQPNLTISAAFQLQGSSSHFRLDVAPAQFQMLSNITQSRLETSEQLLQLTIAPPSTP